MTALPPEPREPPVVQTLRWLLRPISFMESCRRRFGRRLASELRVNGHVLPPGTDVTPAIWLTHTRADRYPEPFAFRPEAFLESAPATYAWVPFGGGVRRCLGAAFAEMEMRVALAEILRLRALAPASAAAERVARRNITFSPRTGTRVIVTRAGGPAWAAGRLP